MTEATLLVTAGRGPAECRDAVRGIVEALVDEAEAFDLSVASDLGGEARPASVVVSVDGASAAAFVRRWVGTVLWIDAAARGRGGRKNWYVAVHALDLAPAATAIDPGDVRFQTMRAGGPGGQHQNTTDSAVRAVHLPTGLTTVARDGRSQHRNRELALRRLQRLAGMRDALHADASRRREWTDRIAVERGNPVRTFRDGRPVDR